MLTPIIKRIYLLEIDSIFSFGALGGMKANLLPFLACFIQY